MADIALFDTLRMPHGHTARGCFNCKHHTHRTSCVKNMKLSSLSNKRCIAYYDREHAESNRVDLTHFENTRANWQKDWEWNGQP